MTTNEELDAARSAALRDPAWQPAIQPENITYEEFMALLNEDLRMWIPKQRPLTRASWWLYVKQFAAREFNKAYEAEFPPRQPETREGSHGILESGETF